MRAQRINTASTIGLVILSPDRPLPTVLPATLRTVLTRQMPMPQPDEGTSAHIFQLSVVVTAPTGILNFATADGTQP